MMKGTFTSALLFSTSGCVTAKLYRSLAPSEYDEVALSFLVTEDDAKCVVLGSRYHYIFDITPSLRHVLTSSLRTAVDGELLNFYVRRNNVVTGDYKLSLRPGASDEQRQSAIDAGFDTGKTAGLDSDQTAVPVLTGHLEGIRYSAEGFRATGTREFTHPYVVKITEQEPGSRLAAKILLTPIAVAADGALVLGLMALIVLGGLSGGRPLRSL
jgi:hypothetical protein